MNLKEWYSFSDMPEQKLIELEINTYKCEIIYPANCPRNIFLILY